MPYWNWFSLLSGKATRHGGRGTWEMKGCFILNGCMDGSELIKKLKGNHGELGVMWFKV
jgi:hypothetical protein